MKKKIIICLIIFVVIMSYFIINLCLKNKIYSDSINNIKNLLTNIEQVKNSYNYKLDGNVDVTAKYRGVHGETHPSNYNYDFDYKNNKLSLYNDSVSSNVDINNRELDIIFNLFKININDLIKVDTKLSKKFNRYEVTLDNNYLSNVLGYEVNSSYIDVYFKSFITKLDYVEIGINDIKINIKDKTINIKDKDNLIKININDHGYSLNVNSKLKANNFNKDGVCSYSVNINNDTYYLELNNDNILVKSNNQHAIYNGLEFVISFDKKGYNKNNKQDNDNPLIRYFSDVNFGIWR